MPTRTRISICALLLLVPCWASAQGRVWPERRHYLVIGSGIGATLGGNNPLSEPTYPQALRVSAVVTVHGEHAIDLTATRIQAVFPSSGSFSESPLRNPEGDALILSYASLVRTRARGFPSQFTLGGGVIRRTVADPDEGRETWIARLGYDSQSLFRQSHMDATVGLQAFVMQGDARNMVSVAVIGLYLRIG